MAILLVHENQEQALSIADALRRITLDVLVVNDPTCLHEVRRGDIYLALVDSSLGSSKGSNLFKSIKQKYNVPIIGLGNDAFDEAFCLGSKINDFFPASYVVHAAHYPAIRNDFIRNMERAIYQYHFGRGGRVL